MATSFVSATSSTTQQQQTKKYTPKHIFVVQLFDGRYVIGAASNPAKRICAINSGTNAAIPKPLQVSRVVAIKEANENRTLPIVVNRFWQHYGEDAVICV